VSEAELMISSVSRPGRIIWIDSGSSPGDVLNSPQRIVSALSHEICVETHRRLTPDAPNPCRLGGRLPRFNTVLGAGLAVGWLRSTMVPSQTSVAVRSLVLVSEREKSKVSGLKTKAVLRLEMESLYVEVILSILRSAKVTIGIKKE
jgi:hypothetical protein